MPGTPPRSRTLSAPSRSTQAGRRAPLLQDRGDLDAAVLCLVVLQQRDQGAGNRDRGAVERVDVLELAAVGPVADVQAARLEVGRVRGRGDLAVSLLTGQPRLEVIFL